MFFLSSYARTPHSEYMVSYRDLFCGTKYLQLETCLLHVVAHSLYILSCATHYSVAHSPLSPYAFPFPCPNCLLDARSQLDGVCKDPDSSNRTHS